MRKVVFGLAAACVWLTVGEAAPPSKTSAPSSITLNVPSTQVAAFTGTSQDSTIFPSIGDSVSFTVSYPKTAEKYGPRIQVICYQNGQIVYAEAGAHYQAFQLGGFSSPWLNNSPGPASCRADLFYFSYSGGEKFNLLASVEFDAGGGE